MSHLNLKSAAVFFNCRSLLRPYIKAEILILKFKILIIIMVKCEKGTCRYGAKCIKNKVCKNSPGEAPGYVQGAIARAFERYLCQL